ncbi:MAG: glutathione synthase [Gammaproteobacteria bacterium]|nr:glutathione synthase [Gammaproteobacteria bacterium]
MTKILGVVMDSISSIKPHKDSTLAMLLAAQARNWTLYYMEQAHLSQCDGISLANMRPVTVFDDAQKWYSLGEPVIRPLSELDVILMRKDPPFDMEYIYTTYMLEQAEIAGTLVVNRPASLRDANEKLFATQFPQCAPPTLVTRDADELLRFLTEQQSLILKPLDGMGGSSIFKVTQGDPNTSVIIETLTEYGSRYIMAQRFIPEISQGDKRILLIDGEPVPYALARIPAEGELRGNLAAGGRGQGVELSERDLWICEQVGPVLREKGLLFVGLDVIGDYLTEINITSPTCIRELDKLYGLNIGDQLMSAIEKKLSH